MITVRALTQNGDWSFGLSGNNYLSGNAAIEQNIQTAFSSFLGNCFFEATAGIDWYNLLGNKNPTALTLAINATILGVQGVTGILQTTINLNNTTRNLSVEYSVTTIYSTLTSAFEFNNLI